jgi:uncharacterized protein YjbI with pentapeptide repeats
VIRKYDRDLKTVVQRKIAMANKKHVDRLLRASGWNDWRGKNPKLRPDLRDAELDLVNFEGQNLAGADLRGANLQEAYLVDADLTRADLSNSDLSGARLNGARLHRAKLCGANLTKARLEVSFLSGANLSRVDLSGAYLRGSFLIRASLKYANLKGADLVGANFFHANLTQADLSGANLNSAIFVEAQVAGANFQGCSVYGISAWNLKGIPVNQQNLIITPVKSLPVTVDDLKVAQFIFLLLNNAEIRDVIDTITSKTVLILGRFSKKRKPILDALRESLRQHDLTPIVFDFEIPVNRDVSETVKVLAGLAKFVVADVTDATEVRAELHNIVNEFPSLPIQPLLLVRRKEFVSLPKHLTRFPWVLPTFKYKDLDHLLANLENAVIAPAVSKQLELVGN